MDFKDPSLARYFKIEQTGTDDSGVPSFALRKVAQPDMLFRNDGGKFTDVTEASGIAGTGFGLSATWWDLDGDGLQDLWVGNDFNDPDRVYHNNGDGTFTDIVRSLVPHITWFSMGADVADLDGDGLSDFVIADMSGSNHFKQKVNMGAMGSSAEFLRDADPQQYMRNAVFLNTGTPRFQEAAYLTGLANTDWTWTVKLCDFDNDGRPDVLFTNGMSRNFNQSDNAATIPQANETEWDRHLRAGTPELREPNLAFRNLGDLRFKDTGKAWGLDHNGMSFAAAHADLDGDGNLDLIVANLGEPVSIYRNHGTPDNNRAVVKLHGAGANTFGIGATVTVEAGGQSQLRELIPYRGYLSSNEPMLHFGLGEASRIDSLRVRWPDGKEQEFTDLEANRVFTITEPGAATPARRGRKPDDFRFTYLGAPGDIHPVENDHDDFERQPLLPNQLSRLGPGMAWGDIDGDGDDDLWTAGAAGKSGILMRREDDGKFTRVVSAALQADAASEDLGGLWFDADGDDDLDLYVASGGYEFEKGDAALRDRLYVNDGSGGFSAAPTGALPDFRASSGTVTACDFDRDGDLDLFVGGRQVPGEYPLPAESILLRNEGGRFSDATESVAGLRMPGLVTASLWSDVNGDGWLDLLLTLEWGPVKIFLNDKGKLSDAGVASGTAALTGWWNGITGRDIDGDGDTDYVVTNFGLNTKYHASRKAPALLYYGDFEGDGRFHIVEAEFEDETLYPCRGRSCSSAAMPHLREKFTSFQQFASADLMSIYPSEKLRESHRFAATVLESGVLINDGSGRLAFQPLPRRAQIAPSFGLALTEFDGDGHPDLYLAQNFHSPQVETGHMDGGVSLLLNGTGDGSFAPVPPNQSGLVVGGDAASVTTPDLDGDGAPDLVIGLNDAPAMAFRLRTKPAGEIVTVRLEGPAGNRIAAGASVRFVLDDGSTQSAEVYAGGGYLSQSPPELAFGIPSGHTAKEIAVRWPDGRETLHPAPVGARTTIRHAAHGGE